MVASSGLQHHGCAVGTQAEHSRLADPGAWNLAALGLPAQLPDQLADLQDALGGGGLTEGEEAAARVDRERPLDSEVALLDQAVGLPRLEEPELLGPGEDVPGRVVRHL